MKKILFLILFFESFLFAQQKYLVSPTQELIPITKHDKIRDIIAKHNSRSSSSPSADCGNPFTFGITPENWPPNWTFNALHKDVVGQWYEAKASGSIDTVFWLGTNYNGAKDSLVVLRTHESLKGPNFGPGKGAYAAAPPCQSWGYWLNSLDFDQGVAAFPDDATDTTWYSTINTQGGTIPPTRPLFVL